MTGPSAPVVNVLAACTGQSRLRDTSRVTAAAHGGDGGLSTQWESRPQCLGQEEARTLEAEAWGQVPGSKGGQGAAVPAVHEGHRSTRAPQVV